MVAAGFRKLLNVTGDGSSNAADLCQSYCDASNYQVRICPQSCVYLCPSICSLTPAVPAPASSPSPVYPDSVIIPPNPGIKRLSPKVFLSVSLSVLAAAFVFFSFLAIRKLCTMWFDRRRRTHQSRDDRLDPNQFLDHDQGPVVDHPIWHIRTVGLQPSVINGIRVVKYKKGDSLIEDTVCAVCLSDFQEEETLRLLPKCNHPFHLPCIDTWLRSHTNCPICRAAIVGNSARLERSVQTIDEASEVNREGEMETENENSDEVRDPRGSVTGYKMNENLVGRSVSMDSRVGHSDRIPSESWAVVMETGGASSSSSSSSSIKRSASCDSKVFSSR